MCVPIFFSPLARQNPDFHISLEADFVKGVDQTPNTPYIRNPVILELDRIKKPANALYLNKRFIDFGRYGEFRIK
jgi:hypothetical protein